MDLGEIDSPKGPIFNIKSLEKIQVHIGDVLTKRLAEGQQAEKEE